MLKLFSFYFEVPRHSKYHHKKFCFEKAFPFQISIDISFFLEGGGELLMLQSRIITLKRN